MATTVDGGAPRVQPQSVPTTTPNAPAEAPKAETATPAAPQASKAPSDSYQTGSEPSKEIPVTLSASRSTGEEIPSSTGFSAQSLSLADFPTDSQATGSETGVRNPNIDVKSVKDANYQHVDGQPFIKGAGDTNDIEWNDIQQGGVGDCYFMSSMGSIAQQNPDVIRNAIKDNGDGSYTVRLYEKKGDGPFGIGGLFGANHYEPKDIRVTPDFPIKDGNPVFAGMLDTDGAKKELWPALMEKAFAQMKGSYGAIDGGYASKAMEMLTGKESKEYGASGVTLDQLDKMFRSGNAMVADSLQNGDKKTPYADGTLVSKHSYMITGVDKGAGTVSLRNPWGPGTPDITMSIADFNKSFDRVNVNPTK